MLIKRVYDIEEIWPKSKRVWTATNIDRASDCVLQFIFSEIFKVPYKLSPRHALGIFIHRAIENFYREDGKPFYKSAESFSNAMASRWQFIFYKKPAKIQGREIEFKNEEEIFILKQEIKEICKKIYTRYSNEEKPLKRELQFDFFFNGKHYRGKIDEIRKNTTIRDIKTGKRTPGEMKLKYDPQFTLYTIALATMCYNSKSFCQLVNATYKKDIDFNKYLDELSEIINLEYYFVRNDEIYKMKRDYINFNEFQLMIDGLERQIENALIEGIYPERGRRCDTCIVKKFCDEITQEGLFIYKDWEKIQAKIYEIKESKAHNKRQSYQLSLFDKRRKN